MAISTCTFTAPTPTASTTSPWSRAKSPANPMCWCAFTANVTPAMFSVRAAVIAVRNSIRLCDRWRRPGRGSSFICARKGEASGWRRKYRLGAQILVYLGLNTIRLLTNNPKKVVGLEGYSLEIVEQVPIRVKPNPHNSTYLKTKREKLGHLV